MKIFLKYISVLLVLLLNVLFGINTVFSSGNDLLEQLEKYSLSGNNIYLHNIPKEKSTATFSELLNFIDTHQGILIRSDTILDNKGNTTGYRVGFYGDPQTQADAFVFTYLGTDIFNSKNVTALLSASANKTLGIDQVEADQIAALPSVIGKTKIVGVKLPDLITSSGTVNGTYRLIGISESERKDLVSKLVNISGIEETKFTKQLTGSAQNADILGILVYGGILASWGTLVFILVLSAYQSMTTLGTHLLLGWSRKDYAFKLFSPLLLSGLIGLCLSAGITIYGLQGFDYTFQLLSLALLSGTPALTMTIVAIGFASISVFLVSPVNAIRNRVSAKVLIISILFFYLVSSAGIVTIMRFLDGPLTNIRHLQQVQQRWNAYANWQILYKEQIGSNASSFTGQSNSHAVEFYNWYRSFEGKPGAYLAHTSYYSQEILELWRNSQAYEHVPNQPYWDLTASPNYLVDQGVKLDSSWVEQAHQGKRIYLIPDTLSSPDDKALEAYLQEYSTQKRESEIKNRFTKDQQVIFYRYHPELELFTWNTNLDLANTVSDPVILLATSENMIPFESESLWATGLENSYIKFKPAAAKKYLALSYLDKYNLADNRTQFLPVANFIAGLQKTLKETAQLFGIVIIMIALLELIIIASLVILFSLSHREQIAVKRLLGYPLYGIFLPPLLLVIGTSLVGMIVSVLLKSSSGAIVVFFFGLIQVAFLLYQARISTTSQLNAMIKTN